MENTITDLNGYEQSYKSSMESSDSYWSETAKNYHWFKPWDTVQSGDFNDLKLKWFEGAKTNMSFNCIDRHLKTRANDTAVIWIDNDPKIEPLKITFSELHKRVNAFASMLEDQGVNKGDRVCFYMGMVPELLVGVLACTRIGAVHSVVFGGFSAASLAGRLVDCDAKILITNDGAYRGGKTIALKTVADEALESAPCVQKMIVVKRTGDKVTMKSGRDFWWHELESKYSNAETSAVEMDSEDPLFILYTSGSTGKPKGLMHTTAGYMVWAGETFRNVFQTKKDSIYWCTADIGWVTGHSYLTYGPLLNGTTTVMFEGVPTYPDAGRFWYEVERLKVSHFYTAPTAIRALEACGLEHVKKYDLSSLKVLGSVGEPINEEAWHWYNENIGQKKCPIVDTWWQTETGGIMISPLAGITKTIPSFATKPLPGVMPVLVDENGKEVSGNPASGNLCLTKPWPGIARTIWGDHERYRQTYFSTYPGRYFTGDGAKRDELGNYRITGRVDDVINVSGHRIGTAEVEDALNQHPSIVESAVVGYPHDIKGQGIYAFVITDKEIALDQLKSEANAWVTKMIGPIAKPDQIVCVSGLPKTRSGKIMRRILRKIAAGEGDQLGDISTLLNPEVVSEILKTTMK